MHGSGGEFAGQMVDEERSLSVSDNRSDNTVVEKQQQQQQQQQQQRRGSGSRRSSNRSMVSSEDNLSHDSYELIEKQADQVEDGVISVDRAAGVESALVAGTANSATAAATAAAATAANKFEQEFYRQAASSKAATVDRASSSSKMSINSSSSLVTMTPPPPMQVKMPYQIHPQQQQPVLPMPILKQPVRRKSSSASGGGATAASQQSSAMQTTSVGGSKQSLSDHYDVVRTSHFSQHHTQQSPLAKAVGFQSHTLPRMPVARYPSTAMTSSSAVAPTASATSSNSSVFHQQFSSRTLPNRRREKSPVYFTRGRLAAADCSSASSSSQASPKMSRPKSLEFNVVVATNALPDKDAFSYQDDTLDTAQVQPPPGTTPPISTHSQAAATMMISKQDQMLAAAGSAEYDDSSSAISGLNELNYASSSDVPQTPEMPSVQFPGLSSMVQMTAVGGTNVVGGLYYEGEHIYDVPEGIEGMYPLMEIAPHPPALLASQQLQRPPPPPPHQTLPLQQITPSEAGRHQGGTAPSGVTQTSQRPRAPMRLPPPPRAALLPTMSSTESESALSARSAPTPVGGNPEILLQAAAAAAAAVAGGRGAVGGKRGGLSVGLISPPEESESTAVIESESNVPAPPEFSGAGVVSDEDGGDGTDVEGQEDLSSRNNLSNKETSSTTVEAVTSKPMDEDVSVEEQGVTVPADRVSMTSPPIIIEEQPFPPGEITEEVTTTSQESTVKRRDSNNHIPTASVAVKDLSPQREEEEMRTEDLMGSVVTLESPPTVFGEDYESTDPNSIIKIADMYVRLGNGSTISSSNGESETGVPFIDDDTNGAAAATVDRCVHPTQQKAEKIFVQDDDIQMPTVTEEETEVPVPPPPPPVTVNPKLLQCSSESSEGSLDIASIPPPPPAIAEEEKEEAIDEDPTFHTSPPMEKSGVIHSRTRPSSDAVVEVITFPLPLAQRSLSRISEGSSSDNGAAAAAAAAANLQGQQHRERRVDEAVLKGPPQEMISSEEEKDAEDDTISESNYTTSDDNNPPSLNSDLPENRTSPDGKQTGVAQQSAVDGSTDLDAVAATSRPSVMQIVRECGVELGGEIEFPSPPSSLLGEEEANPATEFTQLDSSSTAAAFLEVTPATDEADDAKEPERIPYDLSSISSANDVTGGKAVGDLEGEERDISNKAKQDDDDASLHDSMEILEEVSTEDHFERDIESDDDDDDYEAAAAAGAEEEDFHDQRDAFEMLPMPSEIGVEELPLKRAEEEPLEQSETAEILTSLERTGGSNSERRPAGREGNSSRRRVETIVTEEVIL